MIERVVVNYSINWKGRNQYQENERKLESQEWTTIEPPAIKLSRKENKETSIKVCVTNHCPKTREDLWNQKPESSCPSRNITPVLRKLL